MLALLKTVLSAPYPTTIMDGSTPLPLAYAISSAILLSTLFEQDSYIPLEKFVREDCWLYKMNISTITIYNTYVEIKEQ